MPTSPAPAPQTARQSAPRGRRPDRGAPGAAPGVDAAGYRVPAQGVPRLPDGTPAHGLPRLADGMPARGVPGLADGTPARGVPRLADGTPARGFPRVPDGTPAHGFPRVPDGTPARGVPRLADGTPAHGFPRLPDGTPARGVPRVSDGPSGQGVRRFPDGTPPHGFPRLPDGTPAHGVPRARGGHPEQRESGGGWGESSGRGPDGYAAAGPGAALPRQRQGPSGSRSEPRQDYLDAFTDEVDVFAPGGPRGPRGPVPANRPVTGARAPSAAHPSDPYGSVTDRPDATDNDTDTDEDARPGDAPPADAPPAKGGKGRAFTGIAAAAVVTVLAVVVAGQVTEGRDTAVGTRSATDQARDARDSATGADGQPTPSSSAGVTTLTYEQAMGTKYPLSAKLDGSGKFDAIQGVDKAPGKGQKYTYRVDVERGLGLDGELFAEAVQKTLNDDRSWAHGGARTFERVYSGKPDFVITLASPGTTADWCAKSGLDTTEDNVSCDSAATERVMINAYRWAQGSSTYGDQIHAYRQMLINHEVGHRLGYSHVTCDKNGELAPVMQQQTKFLDHDGIHCRANPWPYPGS
ncbi:DUF3152 domain-containing protein [Streptomyces sp. NBC_00882]|uniref:DUF3152 domain-containing protein n=1 Tax=Streptomyces TaxID=1883 RepID=UPI00386F51BC|nr:DUF3152 domain-containing protein [Streptomyces sp. NBC_00882]WSZ60565.1 DUF3152 domain-containing protein [Streptomyces canus]